MRKIGVTDRVAPYQRFAVAEAQTAAQFARCESVALGPERCRETIGHCVPLACRADRRCNQLTPFQFRAAEAFPGDVHTGYRAANRRRHRAIFRKATVLQQRFVASART